MGYLRKRTTNNDKGAIIYSLFGSYYAYAQDMTKTLNEAMKELEGENGNS